MSASGWVMTRCVQPGPGAEKMRVVAPAATTFRSPACCTLGSGTVTALWSVCGVAAATCTKVGDVPGTVDVVGLVVGVVVVGVVVVGVVVAPVVGGAVVGGAVVVVPGPSS